MRIGVGICASCLVLLYATDVGASRNRFPVWFDNQVPQKVQVRVTASSVRSMNIFYDYVVPNPRMLERWQRAGAPYPPAATDIRDPLGAKFADRALVEWLDNHGMGMWLGEVARSPLSAVRRTSQIDTTAAKSVEDLLLLGGAPRAGSPFQYAMPRNVPTQWLMNLWVATIADLAFVLVRETGRRRRGRQTSGFDDEVDTGGDHLPSALVAVVGVAALTALHPILVVNADSIEAWRHNLVAAVSSPLLAALAIALVARALADRDRLDLCVAAADGP